MAAPSFAPDGRPCLLQVAPASALASSGQYRGEFTRAAYDGVEVDQDLLYGFGPIAVFELPWLMNDAKVQGAA